MTGEEVLDNRDTEVGQEKRQTGRGHLPDVVACVCVCAHARTCVCVCVCVCIHVWVYTCVCVCLDSRIEGVHVFGLRVGVSVHRYANTYQVTNYLNKIPTPSLPTTASTPPSTSPTQRALQPLPLLFLQQPHPLPGLPGEQGGEEAVVQAEDAGQDGEPVEEAQVATHDESHL